MLFSVIVPVYNMEKLLARCLNSIVNQTFIDWEIIAIDDGSTDNSSRILDEYRDSDVRIKVIHKENAGIAAAYRDGLSCARGDYICFVDSDDYISKDMLSILNNIIIVQEPDIVQYGIVKENIEGKEIERIRFENEIINGASQTISAYFEKYRTPSLACRAFKRTLFDDFCIVGKNIGIDETSIIQLLGNCYRFVSINEELYHVYVRNNSVSRSSFSEGTLIELMHVEDFICRYLEDKFSQISGYAYEKKAVVLLNLYSTINVDLFSQYHEVLEDNMLAVYNKMKTIGYVPMLRLKKNMAVLTLSRKIFRFCKRQLK